ncbi:MAG: hypothetical protein CMH55_04785 [Myxococcales bacterium]|nr:hypothetical protein [Myxococcales bacterium]
MASLGSEAGYLSDGIAEALADEGLSLSLRRRLAGQLEGELTGEPAAALAWGRAMMEPEASRTSALRAVIRLDTHGWRGRHARALLAEKAPPEEAAALLEAALEPHPSVLASLGHSEFGGSLRAAQRWLELCEKHPTLRCKKRAAKRLSELSR